MNSEVFKMMVVRDRNDIPIKFRVAIVISIGGIVYTLFRIRRLKGPKFKPSLPSPGAGHAKRDGVHVLQDSSLREAPSNHIISRRSSSGRQTGENNFLLPELNELVKECNFPVTIYGLSPKKNGESLSHKIDSPKDDEYEWEIKRLQARVKTLEERETHLETQLAEYYGVKVQESALVELKNQLRLNSMEAKLYNLKIESLLSSNKRLEAQLVDYKNVVMELEAARAKIKGLRKKLKSESEQYREQILALQDRVMKMNNEEKKAAEVSQELAMVVMEREGLKEELEDMKETNRDLKLEIADLTQKLDYVQMLATTALDNEEVLELREERRRLGKQNESLQNEIDSLKADRSKDVGEVVYLRWTNTYLRHKLSEYQAGNKAVSPNLEEKSKQHPIPANANKENLAESMSDLDSGHWSSSQTSCLTEISERDLVGVNTKPSPKNSDNPSKPKVFAKLKKLLRGKGSAQGQNIQKPPLERAASVDDFASQLCNDFHLDNFRNSSGGSSTSRRSFDIPRSYSRGRKSAAWGSSNCSSRTMESLTEGDQDWSPGVQPEGEDSHNEAKSELLKYAEALKKCNSKKFPKRPAQFLDLVEESI